MTNQPNISGRPTERQLAEIRDYGEITPTAVEDITYDVIPEGWSVVGSPRAKTTIFERIVSNTYADQLNDTYGTGNWGVMERSEDMVDIIANTSESRESVETDGEAKDLGHVALDRVVESPRHES